MLQWSVVKLVLIQNVSFDGVSLYRNVDKECAMSATLEVLGEHQKTWMC